MALALPMLRLLRATGGSRPRPVRARRPGLKPPYLKLLRRAHGIEIWLVDGEWVRLHRAIDFAEGAHGLLGNGYIPRNQIWIDDQAEKRAQKFFTLHELRERGLMEAGHGYDEAHAAASALEVHYRAHPRGLSQALKLETGRRR